MADGERWKPTFGLPSATSRIAARMAEATLAMTVDGSALIVWISMVASGSLLVFNRGIPTSLGHLQSY